jgi:hypothetical protein
MANLKSNSTGYFHTYEPNNDDAVGVVNWQEHN